MDYQTKEEAFGARQLPTGETESDTAAALTPSPAQAMSGQSTAVLYRAGFWLRLVAFTIDLVILGVFSLLLLFASLLLSALGADFSNLDLTSQPPLSLRRLGEAAELLATAAYFTILHGETGQTIGKSLLGLEVRTVEGERIGYSLALIRFFGYWVSFFSFGLGFLWVAVNPGKRGWHDLVAGTVVVARNNRE
jgi:uncharacterized RDD family membrane protein YckC